MSWSEAGRTPTAGASGVGASALPEPAGAEPPSRIVLVRHGRSSHVRRGWLDADGLARWLVEYDAAGLMDGEQPPPELRRIAMSAGIVVASDLRRAVASATLLAPDRPVQTSPLLRETPLLVPRCGGVRLPFGLWAVVIGTRWAYGRWRGDLPLPSARTRAGEAAAWLDALAQRHATVVAVTHGAVRGLIARALGEIGWTRDASRRRHHNWSAWAMTRARTAAVSLPASERPGTLRTSPTHRPSADAEGMPRE